MKLMKNYALGAFMVLSLHLSAQQIRFEQFPVDTLDVATLNALEGFQQGDMASADIDGDGDPDLLTCGLTANAYQTVLYRNDGAGNYTRVQGLPFEQIASGAVELVDVNKDTFADALLVGRNNNGEYVARLYVNDGTGNFFEDYTQNFVGLFSASIAVADIDGDQDPDIFMGGRNADNESSLYVYLNDGEGHFSQKEDTVLSGQYSGDILFVDVDLDEDMDVFLADGSSSTGTAELFLNDGSGNFSLQSSSVFLGGYQPRMACSDVDGDQDMDVFLSAQAGSYYRSYLYLNDGEGNYSRDGANTFIKLGRGSVNFVDLDGDEVDDLILSGRNSSDSYTRIYRNNGSGSFSLADEQPLAAMLYSSAVCDDIDADGDMDFILAGYSDASSYSIFTYANKGEGLLEEKVYNNASPLYNTSTAHADVDGDADEDILIMGTDTSGAYVTLLYLNDGSGSFTVQEEAPFKGLTSGQVGFADVDQDDDQDILIAGKDSEGDSYTLLYLNNGSGTFSTAGAGLAGFANAAFDFADIDGDKDPDLLLTGTTTDASYDYALYTNDGKGNFSLNTTNTLQGLYAGSVAFADIDGDEDVDLLLTGYANIESFGSANYMALLYTNNGSGVFTQVEESVLRGVNNSCVAFADIDGDEDLDLFIGGYYKSQAWGSSTSYRIARLYTNDGSGAFTQAKTFTGIQNGAVAFADLDQDDDLDLVITGYYQNLQLYENESTDSTVAFTKQSSVQLPALGYSSLAVVDMDGDDQPDLWLTGLDGNSKAFSQQYRNASCRASAIYPDVDSLPVLRVGCGLTRVSYPTARNSCGDALTASTAQTFPIYSKDTTIIVWQYEDAFGNYLEQQQAVIVKDTLAPLADADTLLLVTAVCQLDTLYPPTATDACAGAIVGTTQTLFPLVEQGQHTIVWEFVDADGNTATQEQAVLLFDDEAPRANADTLPVLQGVCRIEQPEIPTASDNCLGTIYGETRLEFPLSDTTLRTIEWTFTDENGNSTTQWQAIAWSPIKLQIEQQQNVLNASNQEADQYQWIDCASKEPIAGETSAEFTATVNGNYAVVITQGECSDTSACVEVNSLYVSKEGLQALSVYPNPGKSNFTLNLGEPLEAEVCIYSLTGILVHQFTVNNSSKVEFQLHLKPGIYVLSVLSEGAKQERRLSIE